MSKNKITRWIDLQNKRIGFNLAKKVFPKLEEGKSLSYLFKIKFLPYYFARSFLMLLNFFRFNKTLYKPYLDILKSKNHKKGRDLIFQLSGLKIYKYKDVFNKHIEVQDIKIDKSLTPKVSVIIPVYNQINYTLNLLSSLGKNVKEVDYEVIIVDDNSNDNTTSILPRVDNLIYVRNDENKGFLLSCEEGVKQASGEFICFLNNDTYVLENWLKSLIETIENDADVGLVGSKLLYPYGLLQEAGGIIYPDGSGSNYGKFANPDAPRFNFMREVDYCSGASILLRKEDFISLNGFDKRYIPAYYEDTDLCFSIRHVLKKKVIYQPLSQLIHFEGISSGKSPKQGNVKSYQDVNRVKFVEKWAEFLNSGNYKKYPKAAIKYQRKKEIVVVDSYLPFYDKESGSNRIFRLLKIFKELNLHVIFIPKDGVKVEPYYSELTQLGIEVFVKHLGKSEYKEEIVKRSRRADYVWICRPEINNRYKEIFNITSSPLWIYDTIDLHYVRLQRALKLYPNDKKLRKDIDKIKELELSLAKQADVTICITDVEQKELKAEGVNNTDVVPNIHDLKINKFLKFEERKGLIFIGSFVHHPNEDGILWFVNEIMPLVWKVDPDIEITLLGANPTQNILLLSSDRVFVKGYIHDVSDYFESAKVFVAPLRYGAGMKGKIGHSLEYGLPVVTTDIGAEGMGLIDGENALIANTEEEFAEAILALYKNKDTWDKVHQGSMQVIAPLTTTTVSKSISQILKI